MREPHPLKDRKVVLNLGTADPQREMVVAGAVFRIRDWYVNQDPDAIEPLLKARNWAEKWYIERAESNGLPRTELVYGHIDHLGHLVHISELGREVGDA